MKTRLIFFACILVLVVMIHTSSLPVNVRYIDGMIVQASSATESPSSGDSRPPEISVTTPAGGNWAWLATAAGALGSLIAIVWQNRNNTLQLQFTQLNEQQKQLYASQLRDRDDLNKEIETLRKERDNRASIELKLREDLARLEGLTRLNEEKIKKLEAENARYLEEQRLSLARRQKLERLVKRLAAQMQPQDRLALLDIDLGDSEDTELLGL